MSEIVTKGSKTTTGGTVLEGNRELTVEGREITSIGHKVYCPACKETGVIIPVGNREMMLPDGKAARKGDYVACDCPPMTNILLGHINAHCDVQ